MAGCLQPAAHGQSKWTGLDWTAILIGFKDTGSRLRISPKRKSMLKTVRWRTRRRLIGRQLPHDGRQAQKGGRRSRHHWAGKPRSRPSQWADRKDLHQQQLRPVPARRRAIQRARRRQCCLCEQGLLGRAQEFDVRFDNIVGDAAGVAKWAQVFNASECPARSRLGFPHWSHIGFVCVIHMPPGDSDTRV